METNVLTNAIERQYKNLLQEALCILKQPHDAEDAVHNACLKAWSHFPYTAVNACEAWLKVIVYRECITILRKRSRYVVPFDTETICFLYDEEDHVINYMEKQHLRELVESLPIRYSSLVKLRYYEGKDIGEIAQQLHQPANTIRSSLFRARHMLRTRYCEQIRMTI